jgi:spore coat protein U-like protein
MMQHISLSDTLNYNLYTSAAMVKVWGDGTQGSSTVSVSGVKNNTPSVIIYGKIFPLQNVSAGSYSEPLVVTITF